MQRTDEAQKGTDRPEGCGTGRAAISSRTGRASGLFLLAVALAAALATWLLLERESPTPGGSDVEKVTSPDVGAPPSASDLAPPDADGGPRVVGGVQAGPAGDYARMEKVFDGTGTVYGEVIVEQGVPYPETWTVVLEPSRVGAGREHATTRVVESEPGQRTFELRDLPMGAYRIRAEAEGLASMAQELPLFRIAGMAAAVDTANATLKLAPVGRVEPVAWVDGVVRRADGSVADGLAVHLVDPDDPGGARHDATTDSAGVFRFDDVRRGSWLLRVGDPVRPVVPAIPVTVDVAPVRLDDVVLPALTTLRLRVVDEYGRPFPDADLVGYLRGTGSGSFRTRTDAVGEAAIPYLSPGPWRVEASYEPEGQSGRVDVALTVDGSDAVHEILIR